MRKRILLSLLAASIAAVALVSASGAATTRTQKVATIDVSTRAAVIHYLRAIHVNPKGVVIQRGLHNYAGAHCPGSGWTCSRTTHPVVQVAKAGGKNTFRCTTRRCVVVQVAMAPMALTNTAACIKSTGLSQSCTISQSSSTKDNVAIVYENATKSSGLTQTASSAASITQRATGSANANTACVFQNINVTGSTVAKKGAPVTVTLEAHQSVTIKQDSMHGGNTAAQSATSSGHCGPSALAQTQTLRSIANGSGQITQNENAAANGPNVSLDIEQNQSSGFNGSATGANSAIFSQTSNLQAVANTPKGPVNQTQSSPDTDLPFSGLVGTVNQDSRDVSTADATQTETQCEDAATAGLSVCKTAPGEDDFDGTYSLHQTQYGPEGIYKAPKAGQGPVHYVHKGVGTATQTGNSGDTFTIDQSSKQDNDTGTGQTNTVQGDCSTSGNCSITQNTNVDGNQTTNTQSGSDLNTGINCTGTACQTTGAGSANVLIAGAGDFGNDPPTEPNDNLAQALTDAGYNVTESATLPTDLSGFGQVWWVDATAPTEAEQNQLIDFAQSGKGVFLTGERGNGCCDALNAADEFMVNSIVTGGGVTVGGQDVCDCLPVPMPVNPDVVGNLASQPNTLTDWTPAAPGGMTGVPDSSVFSYYQPDSEVQPAIVAAAWDRPSTAGGGRLAVFMDVNWPEQQWRAENWSQVAENVAFFLSGLTTPPSPILLARPFSLATLEPGAVGGHHRSGLRVSGRGATTSPG